MSVTITFTDSEFETLHDLVRYVKENEYDSFSEMIEVETDMTMGDDAIDMALNDDEFSHSYLWAIIIERVIKR